MNITAFGDGRCQYIETLSGGSGAVSVCVIYVLIQFSAVIGLHE